MDFFAPGNKRNRVISSFFVGYCAKVFSLKKGEKHKNVFCRIKVFLSLRAVILEIKKISFLAEFLRRCAEVLSGIYFVVGKRIMVRCIFVAYFFDMS